MSAVTAVHCDRRPLVIEHPRFRLAHVDHWLNRQDHAFTQTRSVAADPKVRHLGLFMEPRADPVSYKFTYHAEAVRFNIFLHCRPDIAYGFTQPRFLNAALQ